MDPLGFLAKYFLLMGADPWGLGDALVLPELRCFWLPRPSHHGFRHGTWRLIPWSFFWVPFLGFGIYNYKVGYPKKGVCYEHTSRLKARRREDQRLWQGLCIRLFFVETVLLVCRVAGFLRNGVFLSVA